MLIDSRTHIVFDNRKHAKELLGIDRYELLIKNRRLIFIDKDNPLQTIDEQIEWVKKNNPIHE